MPVESEDYYAVLGVTPQATQAEIRDAYHEQAMQYHPDRNPGFRELATARLKALNEAHDILGDPERRAAYDHRRRGVASSGTSTSQTPSSTSTTSSRRGADRTRRSAEDGAPRGNLAEVVSALAAKALAPRDRGRNEIGALASTLAADEALLNLAWAKAHFGRDWVSGLIGLTDRRILYLYTYEGGGYVKEWPLRTITTPVRKPVHLFWEGIIGKSTGERIFFTEIRPKPRAAEIREQINAITQRGPEPAR